MNVIFNDFIFSFSDKITKRTHYTLNKIRSLGNSSHLENPFGNPFWFPKVTDSETLVDFPRTRIFLECNCGRR